MRNLRAYRAGAALAITGAALALALGPLAATASAGEYDNWVDVSMPREMTLLPAQNGAAQAKILELVMYSQEPDAAKNVRITIDTGELGQIEADFPQNCTKAGTTVTCVVANVPLPKSHPEPTVKLQIPVQAAKSAKPGARGKIKYTGLTSENGGGRLDMASTEFTVNSGFDLVAGELPEGTAKVKPGDVFDMPVSLTNAGDTPVKSVVLGMASDEGLDLVARHSNCRYFVSVDYTGAICHFPELTLAPGARYQTAGPEKVVVGKDTTRAGDGYSVAAEEDWKYFREPGADEGKPGTDAPLQLVAAPAVSAKMVADLDIGDNRAWMDVVTDLEVDLAAIGAAANGKAGETVKASVGMENRGPGRLSDRSGGEASFGLKVVMPEGVSVVKVPEGCTTAGGGNDLDLGGEPLFPGLDEAGRPSYVCSWQGDYYTYPVGLKGLFAFELKIDPVVPNAKGVVQIHSTNLDKNAANNRAELILNPIGQPIPAPGTSGSAVPAPGESGPDLAETGGSSSMPLIAGAGAGLPHSRGAASADGQNWSLLP